MNGNDNCNCYTHSTENEHLKDSDGTNALTGVKLDTNKFTCAELEVYKVVV